MAKKVRHESYDSMADAAARVRRDAEDRTVVIGPAVWQPSDGTSAKAWYFIIATNKKGKCSLDSMRVPDAETRASFIAALVQGQPPLVIHDLDDELAMARLCETLWPSERLTKIREAIEREQG